jgi:predicted  nucleic acid-binding Zn-ribbon protein
MAGTASLDAALQRLDQALDKLELSVERRLAGERTISGLEEELYRIGEDRARLAGDLDDAMARAGRLEDVNREVSRRLVSAMESIRSVLDTHGG